MKDDSEIPLWEMVAYALALAFVFAAVCWVPYG